jgi:hypothetical protein
MAQAITYSTTGRKRDRRTVVVEDVRNTVVLLPQGSMDVVMAKLLHGTACRCTFWQHAIGADPDTFIIQADQVVAQREMTIAVRVKTHKK